MTFPSLRLTDDMAGEKLCLVETPGTIHPCVATLILTGRATLYLHNGIVYEGSEDTMVSVRDQFLLPGSRNVWQN